MIVSRLSRLLGERRMSLLELQRRTGVPYSSLHPLYHDRATRYDGRTLDRLCRALDCGVADLLEFVPD